MRRAGGTIPYVIGQWVCGERFYGRAALLTEILGGPTRWHWLAGLRRIGKTSLLHQIDHLAGMGEEVGGASTSRAEEPGLERAREDALAAGARRSIPIFWDLQGVESAKDLALSFGEALLDSEERLSALGVETAAMDVESAGPCAAIEALKRAARQQGAEILLLLDEADALLDLAGNEPALPERLWSAIGEGEGARAVLASSLRLADLGLDPGSGRAVPGLGERFGEPRLLGVFEDEEARDLLRQGRMPEASRPAIEAHEVEAIRERCGNHPMLLQILGKRLQELGDLEEAFRQVEVDHSVHHLFAVDFALLKASERAALEAVARGERLEVAATGETAEAVATGKRLETAATRELLKGVARRGNGGEGVEPVENEVQAADRLVNLGLLRASDANGLSIPNRFLADWLQQRKLQGPKGRPS